MRAVFSGMGRAAKTALMGKPERLPETLGLAFSMLKTPAQCLTWIAPRLLPSQPQSHYDSSLLRACTWRCRQSAAVRSEQDKGDKLFRRSMYTYWKRSAPAPNMLIFDSPTREKCVVQRARTNTPLQALVTLNDVHFVEASRKFAARIMREGGTTFDSRIQLAYQLALSRDATAEEIAVCREVFEYQLRSFTTDPEAAKKFIAIGESPRDEALDPVELAAYAVIANLIINLNEVLTRG